MRSLADDTTRGHCQRGQNLSRSRFGKIEKKNLQKNQNFKRKSGLFVPFLGWGWEMFRMFVLNTVTYLCGNFQMNWVFQKWAKSSEMYFQKFSQERKREGGGGGACSTWMKQIWLIWLRWIKYCIIVELKFLHLCRFFPCLNKGGLVTILVFLSFWNLLIMKTPIARIIQSRGLFQW